MHALLLAGILAAPLGFAGLLMPVTRHARTAAGPWPAIRRLMFAVVATTALAAVVAVSLRLLRVSGHGQAVGITGVVCASLAWLPATRRWTARAHLCWASGTFVVIVYLTVALERTFASGSGAASTAGGVLLWLPGAPRCRPGCASGGAPSTVASAESAGPSPWAPRPAGSSPCSAR